METIAFTKTNIQEFITSQNYRNLKNIPISRYRAISQMNNPRADDDDVILVAQFDGNKTVGYLGVLPDFIFISGREEKIGWLTCFWTDSGYKSQNVAANLFRRVIRAWNNRIFITNIVPALEPVYLKTKLFLPTRYKTGYRGYMRFNLSEILPPKKTFFRKITPFLKIVDGSLNIFSNLRFIFFSGYRLDVKVEYLTTFEEDLEEFVSCYNKDNWNRRGVAELNWIITYPWIIQGSHDSNKLRYYFSSLSQRFFYQIVKFTDSSDKTIGVVLINIRDHDMKVPYVFCDRPNTSVIARFLINTMLSYKINMLTVFDKNLSASLRHFKTPFIFSKKIKKPYFISKNFEFVKDLYFQDGDGDCAFY